MLSFRVRSARTARIRFEHKLGAISLCLLSSWSKSGQEVHPSIVPRAAICGLEHSVTLSEPKARLLIILGGNLLFGCLCILFHVRIGTILHFDTQCFVLLVYHQLLLAGHRPKQLLHCSVDGRCCWFPRVAMKGLVVAAAAGRAKAAVPAACANTRVPVLRPPGRSAVNIAENLWAYAKERLLVEGLAAAVASSADAAACEQQKAETMYTASDSAVLA